MINGIDFRSRVKASRGAMGIASAAGAGVAMPAFASDWVPLAGASFLENAEDGGLRVLYAGQPATLQRGEYMVSGTDLWVQPHILPFLGFDQSSFLGPSSRPNPSSQMNPRQDVLPDSRLDQNPEQRPFQSDAQPLDDIEPLWIAAVAAGAGGMVALGGMWLLALFSGGDPAGEDDEQGSTSEGNQPPQITLAGTVVLNENTSGQIARVSAVDPEGDDFSLTLSGADSDLFVLDLDTGWITLLRGLDYEAPQDFNADNRYQLVVTATDALGATSQATLTLGVADVDDERPVISSGDRSFYIDEGWTGSIIQFDASDIDTASGDIRWQVQGPDAAYFAIDAQGTLSLHQAQDFEVPTDANADGRLEVSVVALDPMQSVSQPVDVSVLIQDVWEAGTPPDASGSLDLKATLFDIQQAMGIDWLDGVDLAHVDRGFDRNGNGVAETTYVFVDNDGTSSSTGGGGPSLLVAQVEGVVGQGTGIGFAYVSSGHVLAGATTFSIGPVAGGSLDDHQLTIGGANGTMVLQKDAGSLSGLSPDNAVIGGDTMVVLHADFDTAGAYGSFWKIDNNGTHRGGTHDQGPTSLVTASLTFDSHDLYAVGDMNQDGRDDLVVYSRATDQLEIWLLDQSEGGVTPWLASDNPYDQLSLQGLLSDVDPNTGVGGLHIWNDASGGNSNGVLTLSLVTESGLLLDYVL